MEVFIIAALSADGFISRDESHASIKWRSKEDASFFISKTLEAGALVMGSKTFRTMRRPMPNRRHYILTTNPDQFSEYDPDSVIGINSDVNQVMETVARDGYNQLAVCGGSSVYTQFLQAGLVHRLFLTVEPVLFGQGISLFNQPLDQKIELVRVHDLSERTKVLEYRVVV